MKKRAILIVLDSVGIGALPDAAEFGDAGAHTLGNIFKRRGKLELNNLYKMGLSAVTDSRLPEPPGEIMGAYGRSDEVTKAKDTTCGHWEMMGLIMEKPFRTYPNGFPKRILGEFERRIGRKTLGNEVASGTEILERLGDEHVRTGMPIVYTSADSVFQVAAHEEVIPLAELYRICEIARELLTGDDLVGRIIARPFSGSSGGYKRTGNRRDYSYPPVDTTMLDGLKARGYITTGIGKISDIFCGRGVDIDDHTTNNHDGIEAIIRHLNESGSDFIFANLVDFDMLFGHRNDVEGYAKALEYFDAKLPEIINALKEDDLLIITADHGCDPTYPGTDHTREYIPIIAYHSGLREGVDLGTRATFADIGSTIYHHITGEAWNLGESFLRI